MSIIGVIIRRPVVTASFVGGYVLGARAGRERYEQIVSGAGRLRASAGRGSHRRSDDMGPSADRGTTTPPASDTPAPAASAAGRADEPQHVDTESRLAYTAGPDVEETVEELRAADPDDRV